MEYSRFFKPIAAWSLFVTSCLLLAGSIEGTSEMRRRGGAKEAERYLREVHDTNDMMRILYWAKYPGRMLAYRDE